MSYCLYVPRLRNFRFYEADEKELAQLRQRLGLSSDALTLRVAVHIANDLATEIDGLDLYIEDVQGRK